jgi:hypothetical protein
LNTSCLHLTQPVLTTA